MRLPIFRRAHKLRASRSAICLSLARNEGSAATRAEAKAVAYGAECVDHLFIEGIRHVAPQSLGFPVQAPFESAVAMDDVELSTTDIDHPVLSTLKPLDSTEKPPLPAPDERRLRRRQDERAPGPGHRDGKGRSAYRICPKMAASEPWNGNSAVSSSKRITPRL